MDHPVRFQENRRKIFKKFYKNDEISKKKIGERMKKFCENFPINVGKVCIKFVEFRH